MNKDRWKKLMYGLAAALLLSACSQDELTENTALPEGEYPLQIGSVTLTAEVSEQPWTRVSENPTDGMSSVWTHDDKIGVRIGDDEETGIYVVKLDAEGTVMEVVPEKPVYWKDKQPAIITAWYPVKEELDFTHQDQGLTYLLQGTSNADYNTSANLTFSHQLAKVRVKLEGTKANEVTAVTVRSYPASTHSHGTLDSQDRSLTPQYVPMRRATYGGVEYWEANLRPGTLQANNSFEVAKEGGTPVRVRLENNVSITAGQVHTINISVNPVIPENATDITNVTGDINDKGDYVVSGERNTTINITGGSPTIYLDGATVAVSDGNTINITNNATPTIYVVGSENKIENTSYYRLKESAGIYVAPGSTVTITGNSQNDKLEVIGKEGSCSIGGYLIDNGNSEYASCGNITIKNITLYANSSELGNAYSVAPGIGSVGTAACGTITIENATVHAFGSSSTYVCSAPGIGCGYPSVSRPTSIPTVIITNSNIYAHRGSDGYSDYIGWAGASYGDNTSNAALIPALAAVSRATPSIATRATRWIRRWCMMRMAEEKNNRIYNETENNK